MARQFAKWWRIQPSAHPSPANAKVSIGRKHLLKDSKSNKCGKRTISSYGQQFHVAVPILKAVKLARLQLIAILAKWACKWVGVNSARGLTGC